MSLNDSKAKKTAVMTLLAGILLMSTSIVALSVRPASAFDPGGPPVGGAAPSVPTGNWEWMLYQPTGGSYSPQTQINKDNIQYLETRWIFPIPRAGADSKRAVQYGSITPPLIVDGTVYFSTRDKRVYAVDAATGKIIWVNNYMNTYDPNWHRGNYTGGWLNPPASETHAINYYRDKGWLIPSATACMVYGIDAKDGKTAWVVKPEVLCGTNAEFGDVAKGQIGTIGNQGVMGSQSNPPVFQGNIMFVPWGGGSGSGGRAFVSGVDMSDPQNPRRLYREFVQPPAQGDPEWAIKQCTQANGNGWYFEYPRYLEGINHPARDREPTYLATKCTEVDPEVVRNDWIDMVPGSPHFGKMHTASAIAPVWGQYLLDPQTGIVFVGWGDEGPYPNLTHRYGPAVHGSGFTAHDIRTGKIVWWFDANIRDLWDYDCSWSGTLANVQGKTAYIKPCKNGIVYALDGATGKPFWIYDGGTFINRGGPPWADNGQNYGVDRNNNPRSPDACCRLTKEHMSRQWMNYPQKGPIKTACYTACMESDVAYDGKKVYVMHYNDYRTLLVGNVRPFGNNGAGTDAALNAQAPPRNWQLSALDVNTGKVVWTNQETGYGYRGGISTTGGMVQIYPQDGNLRWIDADTGKLLHQKYFGISVNVMPTIGAGKDGKYRIYTFIGGGGGGFQAPGVSATVDGSLIAFGLPDVIPQPQVITKEVIKEVQVPKEVIKEVVKEVQVPKEVIKEVIKEVPKEVTVETVSPISYAAIGIGVVLVVISGVLFSRKKKV
ncbi:MAG: PQQ-binding-like beta-propeller repeat protein [Thaumarchaeota archaeon]|nr:PQQ-binding-like beta-propeller repeat protein [Nitrososphaerota archaeon]